MHTNFDFDELVEWCLELGFDHSRVSDNVLEVILCENMVLRYVNLIDENDTLIGFPDTPWHTHGDVMFILDDRSSVELSAVDLLLHLKTGDVLINERYVKGEIVDRWLSHHQECICVKHLQPDEEVRVRRLP